MKIFTILMLVAIAIQSQIPSGIESMIGKRAVGGSLKSSTGETVDLTKLLGKRAVVLVFYRGYW